MSAWLMEGCMLLRQPTRIRHNQHTVTGQRPMGELTPDQALRAPDTTSSFVRGLTQKRSLCGESSCMPYPLSLIHAV